MLRIRIDFAHLFRFQTFTYFAIFLTTRYVYQRLYKIRILVSEIASVWLGIFMYWYSVLHSFAPNLSLNLSLFLLFRQGSLVKLVTMGGLYLTGAFLYAARIPERWLPGKCDIWFQSHQLFHVLVVAAAFVHYHGISEMAMRRLKDLGPQCPTLSVTLDSTNIV